MNLLQRLRLQQLLRKVRHGEKLTGQEKTELQQLKSLLAPPENKMMTFEVSGEIK